MKTPALLVVGAAVFVAAISFQAGRLHSRSEQSKTMRVVVAPVRLGESQRKQTPTPPDFERVAIQNLHQLNFEQAFDLLGSAPPDVLVQWSDKLEKLPHGPQKTAALKAFYKTLVQWRPELTAQLVRKIERRDERFTALGAMIDAIPEGAYAIGAPLLVELKATGSLTLYVNKWSRSDPVAASRFVAAHLKETGDNGIWLLLQNWAELDPAAAKSWLEALPGNWHTSEIYEGFVAGWVEAEPAATIKYLHENASQRTLLKAIRGAAFSLFLTAPHQATELVAGLPTEASDEAIDEIAAYATGRMFGSSTSVPPDELAKWLTTLPENRWRGHIGPVLRAWVEEHAVAAESWAEQLAPAVRDEVWAEYAGEWFDDPERAVAAAFRIFEPSIRERTLAQLRSKMTQRLARLNENDSAEFVAKLRSAVSKL